MSALRKTSLFVATASMTIWALVQSPSAQTVTNDDPSSAMEEVTRQMGINPKSSAAAQKKADDAMMNAPNSPPTEADRKAAAAMSKYLTEK
jgi:hypothetical protein